jgi:hypothetical protein
MSHIPRLQGNRFDTKRLKHLHQMGLPNRVIQLRMNASKHIINYWLGKLKLKANREE